MLVCCCMLLQTVLIVSYFVIRAFPRELSQKRLAGQALLGPSHIDTIEMLDANLFRMNTAVPRYRRQRLTHSDPLTVLFALYSAPIESSFNLNDCESFPFMNVDGTVPMYIYNYKTIYTMS